MLDPNRKEQSCGEKEESYREEIAEIVIVVACRRKCEESSEGEASSEDTDVREGAGDVDVGLSESAMNLTCYDASSDGRLTIMEWF